MKLRPGLLVDQVGGVAGNRWTIIDVHVATRSQDVCDAARAAG